MTQLTLVPADSMENWQCRADAWDSLWAMVGAMDFGNPVYVSIRADDPEVASVSIVATADGYWLLRYVRSPEPFMIDVFGASVDVSYDTDVLTWVQVEHVREEREDPPPAGYWLPKQLILSRDDAETTVRRLLGLEVDPPEVPSTRIEISPQQIRFVNE